MALKEKLCTLFAAAAFSLYGYEVNGVESSKPKLEFELNHKLNHKEAISIVDEACYGIIRFIEYVSESYIVPEGYYESNKNCYKNGPEGLVRLVELGNNYSSEMYQPKNNFEKSLADVAASEKRYNHNLEVEDFKIISGKVATLTKFFKQGEWEAEEIDLDKGFYRYAKPVKMSLGSCKKCHPHKNAKIGDTLGAIVVNVPIDVNDKAFYSLNAFKNYTNF